MTQVQKSIGELKMNITAMRKEITWLENQIETIMNAKRWNNRTSSVPSGLLPQLKAMKKQREELIKQYEDGIEIAMQRVRITVDALSIDVPETTSKESLIGLFKASEDVEF